MQVLRDGVTIEQFGDVFALVRRRLRQDGHRFYGETTCRGTFASYAAADRWRCAIPV